jgi:hypothetical protein
MIVLLEGVAHVQAAGDVRRRDHDAVGSQHGHIVFDQHPVNRADVGNQLTPQRACGTAPAGIEVRAQIGLQAVSCQHGGLKGCVR